MSMSLKLERIIYSLSAKGMKYLRFRPVNGCEANTRIWGETLKGRYFEKTYTPEGKLLNWMSAYQRSPRMSTRHVFGEYEGDKLNLWINGEQKYQNGFRINTNS